MTAKRFIFHHDVDGVDYIEDESNGICLVCDELMCRVLNELHEENQLLKQQFVKQNIVEWLRNNTVWEVMPTSHRTYTSTIYHRRNDE